jgi:hypothetical protein
LRIAAIGSRQGPWISVDVEPPTIVIKDDFLDVGLAGFNNSVSIGVGSGPRIGIQQGPL